MASLLREGLISLTLSELYQELWPESMSKYTTSSRQQLTMSDISRKQDGTTSSDSEDFYSADDDIPDK